MNPLINTLPSVRPGVEETVQFVLTREEFLTLVFTLLSAGELSGTQAEQYAYGVPGYGEVSYGG